MKKKLIILTSLLILGNTSYSRPYLTIRTNMNVHNEYNSLEANQEITYKTIGAGAEFIIPANNYFEFGIGSNYDQNANIGINIENNISYANIEEYKSIPIYFTSKYIINPYSTLKLYIKGDVGYSLNQDAKIIKENSNSDAEINLKMKDGLYYGFGLGFEYKGFTLDAMYKITEATGSIEELNVEKFDLNYQRYTITLGYIF